MAAGVNLVTLFDGKVYEANQDIDFADGILILVGFQRAHEESATKSKRLKAAWKSNTEATLSGNRARSHNTPGWIELTSELKDEPTFKVLQDKAAVVRKVFTQFSEGHRPTAIAKALDMEGTPTLKYGRWRGQTVSQLLRSEAPYGHLLVGRRALRGELDGSTPLPAGAYRLGHRIITSVLKDYFPRIVDKETERKVRFLIQQREAGGGAPSKTIKPVAVSGRLPKAMLLGVLRAEDGVKIQRKIQRQASYAHPVTHAYVGRVAAVDQVLIDYWPEVRKAAMIETTVSTEGYEEALTAAQEDLAYLRSRAGTSPRLLAAAEATVEELELDLKSARDVVGLGTPDLPRNIEGMEVHVVNTLVRQLVSNVTCYRGKKLVRSTSPRTPKKMIEEATYDLVLTMRNGVKLAIGEGLTGFTAVE